MRVGLLGCGNVSPQYAIGLGLFPGVELVACADLDGPRAEALAAQHGIAALSPDELIGGDAVDILVNISPGMAHVEVSSAALAAGKHVYSEKPLAVDVAAGTLLLERSRAAGLRLGCAPDTFLGSQLQTARRLLDAGAIGTPVAAHATMIGGGHESWHPNPAIFYTPAGGPMLDMGPYYVTALLSFFGPARRVAASTSARLPERVVGSGPLEGQNISVETPTHYAGVVDYAGGPTATFIVSFDIPHGRTGIEIFGTEGSLAIPDPNVFDAPIVRRTRVGTELREETMPVEHVTGAGRGIGVADLADAIRTNRPHRASAEQALHALETMTAYHRSSDSGAHVTLETTCERPEPLPTATEEVLF